MILTETANPLVRNIAVVEVKFTYLFRNGAWQNSPLLCYSHKLLIFFWRIVQWHRSTRSEPCLIHCHYPWRCVAVFLKHYIWLSSNTPGSSALSIDQMWKLLMNHSEKIVWLTSCLFATLSLNVVLSELLNLELLSFWLVAIIIHLITPDPID